MVQIEPSEAYRIIGVITRKRRIIHPCGLLSSPRTNRKGKTVQAVNLTLRVPGG
jgi:hypothetical protein